MTNFGDLTHISLVSPKKDFGEQCRSRSEDSYKSPLIWICTVCIQLNLIIFKNTEQTGFFPYSVNNGLNQCEKWVIPLINIGKTGLT